MPRDLPSLTLFLWLLSLPALADDTPDFDALEQAGAVIGDVILRATKLGYKKFLIFFYWCSN